MIALVLAGCTSAASPGVTGPATSGPATSGPAPSEPAPANTTAPTTASRTPDPPTHYAPQTVAIDEAGRLYAGDCDSARVIRITGSQVSEVAGSGPGGFAAGFGGDGGPATAAEIQCPLGLAFPADGSWLVADHGNNRIRRIDPAGVISTIAGSGASGTNQGSFSGDGGPATAATLQEPTFIVLDVAGNLYISDRDNNRVRRVGLDGRITTIAGNGSEEYGGDGGPARKAGFDDPAGLAFDAAGNLYVADSNHHRVRRIDRHGIVTTIAGTGIEGSAGDGGPATKAQLGDPESLVFDAQGNLYIGDAIAGVVRRVTPDGTISTYAGNGTEGDAGDGGPATAAQLGASGSAFGLAIGPHGELYIAEAGNRAIRVVRSDGTIDTLVRL